MATGKAPPAATVPTAAQPTPAPVPEPEPVLTVVRHIMTGTVPAHIRAMPDMSDTDRDVLMGRAVGHAGPCPICRASHAGPPGGMFCSGSSYTGRPDQVLHCAGCGNTHSPPMCSPHSGSQVL